MGLGLAGGFAAGGAKDSLRAVLERQFRANIEQRIAQENQQRLSQDQGQFEAMLPFHQGRLDVDREQLALQQQAANAPAPEPAPIKLTGVRSATGERVTRFINPKDFSVMQEVAEYEAPEKPGGPIKLGKDERLLDPTGTKLLFGGSSSTIPGARPGATGSGAVGAPDSGPQSGLARATIDNPEMLDRLTPTDFGKVMDEIYASGATFQTAARQKALNQIAEAKKVLQTVASHPGKAGAIGMPDLMSPGSYGRAVGLPSVSGSASASFEEQLNKLMALLTLPRLQFMRGLGAMSNVEFETIKSSSGALKSRVSEDEFDAELQRIFTALEDAEKQNQPIKTVPGPLDFGGGRRVGAGANFGPGGGLNQPGAPLPDRASRFRRR